MGFTVARREELPDKIYKDCVHCPLLHDCDEIAMVRGPIPKQFGPRDPQISIPLVRLTTPTSQNQACREPRRRGA